jgi:RNA polymerase sigma factor (TIGR02999 family)
MPAGEITDLLARARGGDRKALDRLMPLVYQELHAMAHARLRGSRDATLNTTALVHEAYLKLFDHTRLTLTDRSHFFAVAALAMRQIVVDHARRQAALKRGGGDRPIELDRDVPDLVAGRWDDVLSLEEALGQLAQLDPRLARIVELRFFAGLSVEEVAEVVERDPRTVRRDWRKAKALLQHTLRDAE